MRVDEVVESGVDDEDGDEDEGLFCVWEGPDEEVEGVG